MSELKLNARWTDDCSGKKDYDGPILSISTRYWPRGGGFLVFDSNKSQAGMQGNETRPEIRPSANCSLSIDHGDGDYLYLIEKNFEADTEEEVRSAVEAWAQEQMDRAVAVLLREFKVPDTSP